MTFPSVRIPIGIALISWLASLAALASAGRIEFSIRDASDGSPVAGAVVELRPETGEGSRTARSDGAGRVVFDDLAAGTFEARVTCPGYATLILPDLAVAADRAARVPVAMVPSREDRVQVVGRREMVETESPEVKSRFDDAFLEQIPVAGRFFQNVLTLAPGVQDANGDGNPNVHGSRERDFKVVIGGVSNQDPLTGLWLGRVPIDGIEAMEVITAGAGAKYGRAQGGFAAVVLKQGGNRHEGTIGMIWRTSRLDGNGASGVSDEFVPDFHWYQPSLQLTGPIVRDRLWYRLTHEYQDTDRPLRIGGSIQFQSHRQWIHDDQLTWQVSPRNKLALRLHADPSIDSSVGLSSFVPVESTRSVETGGRSLSLTWTAPVSPNLLVESQVAYQNYGQEIRPTTQGVKNRCVVGLGAFELAQCTSDGLVSGSYPEHWSDTRERLTVSADAEWLAGRTGRVWQTVRGGAAFENERYYRSVERGTRMDFEVLDGTIDPARPQQLGIATTTFSLPLQASDRATSANAALWMEDQIRLKPGLVLTLGLRYDYEHFEAPGYSSFDPRAEAQAFLARRSGDPSIDAVLVQEVFTAHENLSGEGSLLGEIGTLIGTEPPLASNAVQSAFWQNVRQQAAIRHTNRNWSPRASLSWDPWADGKTRFAATAGRYYDKIFLAVPLTEREPDNVRIKFTALEIDGKFRVDPFATPVNPASDVHVVDHAIRTPYQDEFTLSVERELPVSETSIRLSWINRHYRDQLQDFDMNRLPGDLGKCAKQTIPYTPTLIPAYGAGLPIIDPFTGETYVDTDPGAGDGRLDDCSGLYTFTPNPRTGRASLLLAPDGVPDLYVQNPGWGSLFKVGNYNAADYKAWQLELRRRRWNGWEGMLGYTFSRAVGDAEDFAQTLGNDRSLLEDERGYLSYDQRHVVKLQVVGYAPGEVALGASVTWQSGLPYSLLTEQVAQDSTPPYYGDLAAPEAQTRTVYVTGRRNDQRNEAFWSVDLRVEKAFRLERGVVLRATAEVFNALNEGTYTVWNTALGYGRNLDGKNEAYTTFGREWQLGLRVTF